MASSWTESELRERLAEVEARIVRAERLAALVGRTADRLFEVGGKPLRHRGHEADGAATEFGNEARRLGRDAAWYRRALVPARELSVGELFAEVFG